MARAALVVKHKAAATQAKTGGSHARGEAGICSDIFLPNKVFGRDNSGIP